MYLVNRKLLLLLAAAGVGIPILLGVRTLLLDGGLGEQELKLWAENGFFLSLLAGLLLLTIFLAVLKRSRDVLRELDKVRDLARYASFSSSVSLRRLGRLGEKIRLLYLQLTELNDKKSLKISTQAGLIDFLLETGELPLLIIDPAGRISRVSRQYLENFKLGLSDLAGKSLSEVLPDRSWQELADRLETGHQTVKEGSGRETLVFYPVFNRDAELSAVVCVRGRETLLGELSRLGDETGRTVERVRRFIRKKVSPDIPAGGSTRKTRGSKRRSI